MTFLLIYSVILPFMNYFSLCLQWYTFFFFLSSEWLFFCSSSGYLLLDLYWWQLGRIYSIYWYYVLNCLGLFYFSRFLSLLNWGLIDITSSSKATIYHGVNNKEFKYLLCEQSFFELLLCVRHCSRLFKCINLVHSCQGSERDYFVHEEMKVQRGYRDR